MSQLLSLDYELVRLGLSYLSLRCSYIARVRKSLNK